MAGAAMALHTAPGRAAALKAFAHRWVGCLGDRGHQWDIENRPTPTHGTALPAPRGQRYPAGTGLPQERGVGAGDPTSPQDRAPTAALLPRGYA